jgi:hypothetical protein
MNNISLEIIEKEPVKEKKVTIHEEKNTTKIIPQEGKGNPLPPTYSLSTLQKNKNIQQRRVVYQRPIVHPMYQPRRTPFMMNFNRNIGMMPMHFK